MSDLYYSFNNLDLNTSTSSQPEEESTSPSPSYTYIQSFPSLSNFHTDAYGPQQYTPASSMHDLPQSVPQYDWHSAGYASDPYQDPQMDYYNAYGVPAYGFSQYGEQHHQEFSILPSYHPEGIDDSHVPMGQVVPYEESPAVTTSPSADVQAWPSPPDQPDRHIDHTCRRQERRTSPYTMRSRTLPSSDSAPRDQYQQSSTGVVSCGWDGCAVPLDDATQSGLKRHFRDFHNLPDHKGHRGVCQWMTRAGEPCGRELDCTGFPKHIANFHLRSMQVRCPSCGDDFGRQDTLKRHMDRHCPSRHLRRLSDAAPGAPQN